MWNTPSKNQLAELPRLYETESIPAEDKIVYLHFFLGSADWYIVEYDGDDTFFGFVNLGDPQMAEWGYISFSELKTVRVGPGFEVDNDLYWQPRRVRDIPEMAQLAV